MNITHNLPMTSPKDTQCPVQYGAIWAMRGASRSAGERGGLAGSAAPGKNRGPNSGRQPTNYLPPLSLGQNIGGLFDRGTLENRTATKLR